MKNEKLRKFLYSFFCVILIVVIFIQPISVLYNQKDVFFSKGYSSRYNSLKEVYSGSQYAKKINAGIISDQALEAYAAGAFLKGVNPILIIHDQPPLGRYILSSSILFFDNPNTIMILLFFLSGLGVFLIARLVIKNTLFSLAPFAVFINEPLFLNKFYYTPLLEPVQLPFIIFALYFFVQGIVRKNYVKWFILTSIMLGFVISIRFFILGTVLVFAMILYFLLKRQFNKKFALFLTTLPIALFVLIASYTKTIQFGSSILNILVGSKRNNFRFSMDDCLANFDVAYFNFFCFRND